MTDQQPGPLASPVCYAIEASDSYMGYLDRDELVLVLQELLQAERAGSRAGARLAQMAHDKTLLAMARTIRDEDARWCRMLSGALRRLGVRPSARVGALYDKVMALEGFVARLARLERGQASVVRRLKEALPKVRDDRLHADLKRMLQAHVECIERVQAVLERALSAACPVTAI